MEMVVGIDGFNVEGKEFLFSASDNEREGSVGTEDVPKDVAKEGKEGSDNVKTEEEENKSNHTNVLVLVVDSFLWPKVRCLVSLTIFS